MAGWRFGNACPLPDPKTVSPGVPGSGSGFIFFGFAYIFRQYANSVFFFMACQLGGPAAVY
jgi:hypothetical protein